MSVAPNTSIGLLPHRPNISTPGTPTYPGGGRIQTPGIMPTLQSHMDQNRASYGQFVDRLLGGHQGRVDYGADAWSELQKRIGGMHDKRYGTAMSLLEGSGQQALRDIDRRYKGLASRQQQDMISRGLTGSTIAPSMQWGVERERQDARGREIERIRREQLATHLGASGDRAASAERLGVGGVDRSLQQMSEFLGAQERVGGTGEMYGREDRSRYAGALERLGIGGFQNRRRAEESATNAWQQNLQQLERLGILPSQMNTALTQNILDILGSRVDQPGQSMWLNASRLLGSINPPSVEQPKTDYWGPAASAGGDIASSFLSILPFL